MPQDSPVSFPLLRKLLPYTTIAACVAILYTAFTFYSRWNANREIQRAVDAKSVEQAQKTFETYGAGQLKIMLFYANPPMIRPGGKIELCYSVANAAKVSIDQGVEPIAPSLSRCVPASPKHSASYTLTATDEKGRHVSKSIDIVVQ